MISLDCTHGRTYRFEPAHTALLVIDMQRDFLDHNGMCHLRGADIEPLRAIIPHVRSVLEWARGLHLAVVHTREGYAPDGSDMPALKKQRYQASDRGPLGRFLICGEPGQGIIPELSPLDGETVIDKPGFSAFYRTDLEQTLGLHEISHLIVTGVTTQCCVHSTLRDAVDRGYHCLTLSDCCAALEKSLHDAAISLIHGENHLFGWVSESSRIPAVSDPQPAV